MKRFVFVLYTIIGVCLLASCGSDMPKPASEAPEKVVREWLDSARYHIGNHDLKQSMKFLKRAEAAAPNVNNDSVCFRIYQYLAWVNESSSSPQLALSYLDKAKKHAKATKKGRFIVDVLNHQVLTLYKLGRCDSAWMVTQEAMKHYPRAAADQRSVILQHMAYHKLLVDSLEEAERILRKDTDLVFDSAVYNRLPMESVMQEDLLTLQNQFEQARLETEKARQQMYFSWVLVLAVIVIAGLVYGYRLHERRLVDSYESFIEAAQDEMQVVLGAKSTTIEQMKASIDASMREIKELKQRLPKSYKPSKITDSIEEIKLGVDVLYAILHDENISQYGRREQKAVVGVIQYVDNRLVTVLADKQLALTPKETFFCIMEHYGKNDDQKALSFCCSEQAIRSTTSRLGKKLSLASLHN